MIKKIIIVIVITQFTLGLSKFALTMGRATDGDRLVEAEIKLDQLTRQNTQLEEQINQKITISQVQKFALLSGFVPQTLIQLDPAPVAARLNTP